MLQLWFFSMIKTKVCFFSVFPGSEECSFPHLLDDSKDWSPESPDTSCSRPQRVHSCTQTEAPQLPPAACTEVSGFQPVPPLPAAPALTSCPSPVHWRKERHCAKWENREEESKPTYECLESVSVGTVAPPLLLLLITQVSYVSFQDNDRLLKANETLRVKLREAEWEVEMLKTLLKRQDLQPVEEDSSWSTHTPHLMSSGRLVLPPYGRIYKPTFTITYYFTCMAGWSHLASQSASQWD